jgi:hypothetical protein
MGKADLRPAKIEDFLYWITERHSIWKNRFIHKKPKPWSKDPLFQKWKFTNVFRQLDTGTIILNDMLGKWFKNPIPFGEMDTEDAIDILFNIIWYRMFNVADHAINLGFVHHKDHKKVLKYLIERRDSGKQVFTGAYMVSGTGPCERHGKVYGTFLAAKEIAEKTGERWISFIYHNQSLRKVHKRLQRLPMLGHFNTYEVVCDLRFTPLLCMAEDIFTWANMGPGAERGLRRLGLPVETESMIKLYKIALKELPKEITHKKYPPFELREIEHSLCEFDKYQRVKTGVGRPRSRYPGA